MWELIPKSGTQAPPIKGEFTLLYSFDEDSDSKMYKYYFDITDYQVCVFITILFSSLNFKFLY